MGENAGWTPTRIETGLSIVRRERARFRAEIDAFEAFAERITVLASELPDSLPAAAPAPGATPPLHRRECAPNGPRTGRVRRAYRQTVMDVDHFDAEYAESPARNLAAELDEDLAAVLLQDRPVSPLLCRALGTATERARHRRRAVVAMLTRERDELERRRDDLLDIEREREQCCPADWGPDPADLFTSYGRVDALEARCLDLVRRRQRFLRHRLPDVIEDELMEEWCGYLYSEPDWSHPVLADASEMLRRLSEMEEQLSRRIARNDDRHGPGPARPIVRDG